MANGSGAAVVASLVLVAVPGTVTAQAMGSSKPIRLLVASAPGGPSDFVARLIAPRLSEGLGQNVVVDARASVNGIVATELAARAAPDGHTLSIGNNGTHVVNLGLYRKLPYDPLRDFVAVSQMVSAPTTLVAAPRAPFGGIKDLVAAARREPGRYNIGIAGANGAVGTEVLKSTLGISLTNVPYKGSTPTELAVISGEVEVALVSLPASYPHVRSGKMKCLGVSRAQRSPLLPEVPTFSEQGMAEYPPGNWHGLFVPAGTPQPIVQRLHREVAKIFAAADVRDLLASRGNDAIASSPAQFASTLQSEIARFSKVMAAAGIRPE